jgi:hypothetical protein
MTKPPLEVLNNPLKTQGKLPSKSREPLENPRDPPANLRAPGHNLWRSVLAEFEVSDTAGLTLLRLACQALDRAEGLRARIDADGETIQTAHGVKSHPGIRDELANRAFVAKALERLGHRVRDEASSGQAAEQEPLGWRGVMPRRARLARLRRSQFSDEALATYAEMRQLRCTCESPGSLSLGDRECASCRRWWSLHGELWRQLPRHPPWLFPLLPRRDEGTEAQWELEEQLEEALDEKQG